MTISKIMRGMFLKVAFAILPGVVFAGGQGDDCAFAARSAAAETSVPLRILTAIYTVETGGPGEKGFSGWPWSVNIDGESHRFDTKKQAEEFANTALNSGKRNLDIGCFQVNIRWHSKNFRSLSDMLDPVINAKYAAHYLSNLFDQHGDWKTAVGAYHSNDPDRAEHYAQKVEGALIGLAAESPATSQQTVRFANRHNSFPLFQNSVSGSSGSTFPPLAPLQPLIVLR